MSSREIVLRLDERWYKALNHHLKNETLEEHMEDVLDELCNQIPQREYERISREIWQEDQENRQAREAEQKIAAFHVTENGESVCFSTAESMELLQAAVHLRNYLSDKNADTKFTAIFPRGEKITQEQFDAAATERMENTGHVTGAYELDFDARTFSALNIMDGWKVYAMQDVADAARQAFQETEISEDARWRTFIDRLDGQELTAPSRLTIQNFCFADTIEVIDGDRLNFYLVPDFSVDKAFGTSAEAADSIYTVNLYANYDMVHQHVCNELEIVIYGGTEDKEIRYPLNVAEKDVLRTKMEAYCMEQEHIPLEQFCKEILQDQEAAPAQEMQM